MNSIKTKMRNILDVDHVEDIMMIKMHLSDNEIDIDNVYNPWKSENGRRDYLANYFQIQAEFNKSFEI